MKRYLNIKLLLVPALVGSISLLSSCLKNNKYYVDFSDYKPSIELPLAATAANKPYSIPLDVSPDPQDVLIYVNIASMDKPSSPVTATIAFDPDYLDQYNAEQDAATKQAQADYLAEDPDHTTDDDDYPADYVPYKLFPDSLYTIDNMKMTVAAGERQAFVTAKVITEHMDFSEKYILPFTITDVEPKMDISNWNHLMLNIQAKNAYDGSYSSVADGSLGHFEYSMTLSTVDQFTCSTNLFGYYSNAVYITVDPATNKVTVNVPSLQPTVTDPSSHYDPDTHTFYLKYKMASYEVTQKLVKK